MKDFDKCTVKVKRQCGRTIIKCKLGLWGVAAASEEEAVRDALHYFEQHKADGEYSSIIGGESALDKTKECHMNTTTPSKLNRKQRPIFNYVCTVAPVVIVTPRRPDIVMIRATDYEEMKQEVERLTERNNETASLISKMFIGPMIACDGRLSVSSDGYNKLADHINN
jgi:PHD/YefM family antitoxin component YafN of YafNO toxin-antitoxin module